MKKLIVSLSLIIVFAMPTSSYAGYVFEKEMDMGSQKMNMVYSIEGQNKRIDILQNGTMVSSMISTPKRKNPIMLIHSLKQYMEQKPVDEAQRDKTNEAAMQSMVKNMGSMTKEQKAVMDKMMKSHSEKGKKKGSKGLSAADFTVKTTGKTKKIGSYNTTLVKVLYKGSPFQNLWVTKDIPSKAMKAMNAFATDEKLNTSNASKALRKLKTKVDKYGYPILTIAILNSETKAFYGADLPSSSKSPKEVKIEMKKIEKKNISKNSFKAPKEYKEMSL